MLAPIRFLWNSTRSHRFAFWRSEYLRWRIETYSGKRAETLTIRDILSFFWQMRWEMVKFLFWINRLDRETRRRP